MTRGGASPASPRSPLRGYLWGLLAVILWGIMFPAGTAIMQARCTTPAGLGMLRYLIAGAFLLPVGCLLLGPGAMFPRRAADWPLLALAGLVGASLMCGLLFLAQQTIPSVNASLLEAYVPLLVLVFSLPFDRRRPSLRLVFSILLGFAGTLLVLRAVTLGGLQLAALSRGDLYIFLSGLCWAVYTAWGRPLARRMGGIPFTAWTCVFGGLWFLLWNVLCGPRPFPLPASALHWGLVLFLALGPAALAYLGWNAAQRHLTVNQLAFLEYFAPAVAALAGLFFLREPVTVLQWVGIAVVILSARLQPRA